MSDHEMAGDAFVPAKQRNLPNRILKAFDNAKHLSGLSRGVKDTLGELCRFVPQQEPFATIFAHKRRIAERLGASERTIYRHLAILAQSKLIEVLQQERKSRNGRFAVARIRLTAKAAALVGLIAPNTEATDYTEHIVATAGNVARNGMIPSPSSIQVAGDTTCLAGTTSDAVTSVPPNTVAAQQVQILPGEGTTIPEKAVIHNAPSAILSVRQTLSVPTIAKNQPLQRTQNGLPIDLAWLTGNGLSRSGVFKLMGMAKAKRKRLSDIVIVVRDYIKELKGGRLFSYLAALCNGPTDFVAAAANERQRQIQAQKERELGQKITLFRERFRKTALTNRQQTRLYLIDDRAQFVQIFGGACPASQPLQDVMPWIEGIESGRLVLATMAVERRFLV